MSHLFQYMYTEVETVSAMKNLQLQDSRLDLTVITPNLWLHCWLERPVNWSWQTATVLFAAAVTVCCADTPLKVGNKDIVPVIP